MLFFSHKNKGDWLSYKIEIHFIKYNSTTLEAIVSYQYGYVHCVSNYLITKKGQGNKQLFVYEYSYIHL